MNDISDNTTNRPSEPVQIGAEVWIEPDMTRTQIDHFMRLLRDHAMPVARIFLEWNSAEANHGPWSLELYDQVFASAAQHDIGIVATLAPPYPAYTCAQMDESRRHVSALVERYKNHPALDTWLLVNEPGAWLADSEVAMEAYIGWLEARYGTIGELNQAWGTSHPAFEQLKYHPSWATGERWNCGAFVDCRTFWRQHQTWQLRFIAETIRAQDSQSPIHVNPHGLMGNLAGMNYDLPEWRTFLTTLGVSLHPAWHFGLLERRDQFALGTSYMCDLVRGASEPNPFWVTELQGGNNIYSGTQPLCPEPEDIAQWTWTGIAGGARRVIYWLLNARHSGIEAGEWSLLDLQCRPSERLETAGEIAQVIQANDAFFSASRALETPVTLILSLETMTIQQRYDDEGGNGHILEALGLYEAFQQLGIPVQIKHIHDFAWRTEFATQPLVILPHVSALSREQAADISEFVRGGGHVLATGLTGFYDPMTHVWPLGDFPLSEAFGGTFKEVRHLSEPDSLEMAPLSVTLPTRGFACEIENHSGEALCRQGRRIMATTNRHGEGRVHWVPSLIGLGSWRGNRRPLADFLCDMAGQQIAAIPFRFAEQFPDVLLRTLRNGDEYVTSITNGAATPRSCRLLYPGALKPRILWHTSEAQMVGGSVTLNGRGTIVIQWTR